MDADWHGRWASKDEAVRPGGEEGTAAFSVIVCTRDRPASLQRCLASLQHIDYGQHELIVVDNAPAGNDTALVAATTPGRYVREDRLGLNWARNRGAAEARHGLLAYVDDDVVVEAGWLPALERAFMDPRVAAVTGLVRPAETETEAQRLFEQYSGMGKGEQARLLHREGLSWQELLAAHQVGAGANMAFRRHCLAAIGGFDTALDVGSPARGGGDIDVFHRLLVAGQVICYEPAAVVRHYHRRTLGELRRQLYDNGCSYGVYLLKVLRNGSAPRAATLDYAARWFGGWVVARLLACLVGALPFPWQLAWAELWGALHAPAAYVATYRRDRRLRR